MTQKAQENLLKNKARLLSWIGELDRVIRDISLKGTASASVSAGGGSQSYTRLDLSRLQELRAEYARRVMQIKRCLDGVPSTGIRRVMQVRCC